jgi:hypothetical protein
VKRITNDDLFVDDKPPTLTGRKRGRNDTNTAQVYTRAVKPRLEEVTGAELRLTQRRARHDAAPEPVGPTAPVMWDMWDGEAQHSLNGAAKRAQQRRDGGRGEWKGGAGRAGAPQSKRIMVPGGVSYHPSVSDHQSVLASALEETTAAEKRSAAIAAAASWGSLLPIPHITDVKLVEDEDESEDKDGVASNQIISASKASQQSEKAGQSLSRRDRERIAKGRKPRLAAQLVEAAVEKDTAPSIDQIAAAASETQVSSHVSKPIKQGHGETEGHMVRPRGKVNRGASGKAALSVPLSEELSGSLRLMKPAGIASVAVDSLGALVRTGKVAPKTTVRSGKDSGKKKFRYVEFPRRGYIAAGVDVDLEGRPIIGEDE